MRQKWPCCQHWSSHSHAQLIQMYSSSPIMPCCSPHVSWAHSLQQLAADVVTRISALGLCRHRGRHAGRTVHAKTTRRCLVCGQHLSLALFWLRCRWARLTASTALGGFTRRQPRRRRCRRCSWCLSHVCQHRCRRCVRDAPSLLTFRRLLKMLLLLFEQSYDVSQYLQRFCVNLCKVPLQHFCVKRHYNQFIFNNNNNNTAVA